MKIKISVGVRWALRFSLLSIPCFALAQSTPSDRYCFYLQSLQAREYREGTKPTTIDSILQFINALMQKVSFETVEGEAIQKKMSFEEFQKWAKNEHALKISDHYKPRYLERYIKDVCGEITNSATFGSAQDPEMGATAEKQFDPSGHPYQPESTNLPQSK